MTPTAVETSPTAWDPEEGLEKRLLFGLMALAIMAGFFIFSAAYFAGAHHGVDQNGYLVGGKQMTRPGQLGSTKLTPRGPRTGEPDPFQFVGAMWVGVDLGTPAERYYPKYPSGYPALVAAALWAGGPERGVQWAYWINPICMTLALGGTFLLVRGVAGSFAGVLAMVLLATSPVTLGLTNNPNSHAASLCFAAWGMHFLMRWVRRGGGGAATLAGMLLGSACTIRYTDGLLLLPALVAISIKALPALFGTRRTVEEGGISSRTRTLLESALVLAWWGVPVLLMVCFNLRAFGSFTGYDKTQESAGFAWAYFTGDARYVGNWETFLRLMNASGLFLAFPFGLFGLLLMLAGRPRWGMVLGAWLVPGTLVYLFYYWAPAEDWLGYMRFFLGVFPGWLAAVFWMLRTLGSGGGRWASSLLMPLAMGGMAAVAVLVNLNGSLVHLEADQQSNLLLARGAAEMMGFGKVPAAAPAGSVIFGPESVLNHLQFVGDYVLYTPDTFNATLLDRAAALDLNELQGNHAERALALKHRLGGNFDQKTLSAMQSQLVEQALAEGKGVFFVTPIRRGETDGMAAAMALLPGGNAEAYRTKYDTKVVARWSVSAGLEKQGNDEDDATPRRNAPERPRAVDSSPTRWGLVEFVRKATPATRPTTVPVATSPCWGRCSSGCAHAEG